MTFSKFRFFRIASSAKAIRPCIKPIFVQELLDNGEWSSRTFKQYNYDAAGVRPAHGFLHPLLKLRSAYRQIFLDMGFEEMPTQNFVESSFWNFDSLFQPQQHPARKVFTVVFKKKKVQAKITTDFFRRFD